MAHTNRSTVRWFGFGIVAISMIICTATQVQAQGFVSPLIGYDFSGDTGCPNLSTLVNCEDKKINISVGFGAMGNVVGFEEEVAYAPSFFGTAPALSSSVLTLMSNVMLVPKIGPVRPYFLAGVGLLKTHVDLTGPSLLSTNDNGFGWDVGGGVIGMFGAHVGLRGDLRYFHSFSDLSLLGFSLSNAQNLNFGRASAGLVFKF